MCTGTEKVPEPGIFHISGGIGKIWYRKKVSESVSVKFGTAKPCNFPTSQQKIFSSDFLHKYMISDLFERLVMALVGGGNGSTQ